MNSEIINQLCGPTSRYSVTRFIFLRALGIVNCIAFISLWVQIDGLIGSHGITPAATYFEDLRQYLGHPAWHELPTLCWLDCSDGTLHGLCAAGTVASLLLVADVAPAACLAACWICYLSLSAAGQEFLTFQWDSLLLETDFLAILLAPPTLLPRRPRDQPAVPTAAVWLLRLLLFRLMFCSGLVKLTSGDPHWRGLTALRFHYETQPLPTPLAWYAHCLPHVLQSASAAIMLVIELLVPLLLFTPRRWRLHAFWPLVGLQILIALTGNYGFFNLLTIVLCIGAILDDDALRVPARDRQGPLWPQWIVGPFAALLLVLSLPFPTPVSRALGGFQLVGRYGLFAVMTTERPEIVIEGSRDGTTWVAYEFRYKPGDPMRAPPVVAPYMPRLDWQMWFAALGPPQQSPWLEALGRRLLEGEPAVTALLAQNPFPDAPPRYVRAVLYLYRFNAEGPAWWTRSPAGPFLEPLSLSGR